MRDRLRVFPLKQFKPCALFLAGALALLALTGCKSDSPHPKSWVPPQSLQITTPYLIRIIEKNGMDALDQEHPYTSYVVKARYPEYAQKQFINLNDNIFQYVNAKVEDFEDVMFAGSYEGTFPQESFSKMSIDFVPFHYTTGFVSILFEGFEQTPAIPKGFKYYQSMNYDALNGELLTLEDCLVGGESALEELATLVAKKLAEQEPELNEKQIQRATDPNTPENYELFIIRPGEFMIFFQPLQLSYKIKERRNVTIDFNEIEVQPFIKDIIAYSSWIEFNGEKEDQTE